MKNPFRKSFSLVFTLFLGLPFTSNAQAQKTNVLFIGNSYTHMNNMPKIFENLARSKGKDVYADSIAVSGSTLKLHAGRPSTYAKLKKRKWDIIVVQGFSRELAHDSATIAKETIPYIQQILDSAFQTSPCASVYFYMTWGYKEGYIEDPALDSFEKMRDRIAAGYNQLQKHFNYPIVPVGMAWSQLRQEHPEINLYVGDNQHPTVAGSFLIANCFYTAFFKKTATGGTAPKSLDSTAISPIVTVASSYVLANYNYYHLNQVQHPAPEISPFLSFKMSETWTVVTISNKSKNCNSYLWDFGDGTTSKQAQPKHYYKNPGTYTVTLTATKDCNTYELKKRITVSKTDKHATSAPKPKSKGK